MTTPIKSVQFIQPVSFGGQKPSLNRNPSGERPGQTGHEIDIDEKHRFVTLSRMQAGKLEETIVPMSNVASFVPLSDEEMAKLMKAREDAKPKPQPQVKK